MNVQEIGKIIENGVSESKFIVGYLDTNKYNLTDYTQDKFVKKIQTMFGVIYQKFGEDWKEKHLKVINLSNAFRLLDENERIIEAWRYMNEIQKIYLSDYKVKNKRIS